MVAVLPMSVAAGGVPRTDAPRLFRLAAAVLVLHVLALWVVHAARMGDTGTRVPPRILTAVWVASEPRSASTHAATQFAPPPVAPSAMAIPKPAVVQPQVQPTPGAPQVAAAVATRSEVLTSTHGEVAHGGVSSVPPAPAATTVAAATAGTTSPPTAGATAVAGADGGSATRAASQAVEWPAVEASYLQNPPLDYPRLSRLRGEQGRVLVNVLIGVEGRAQKVELKTGSGFERLDQAALTSVQRWRFVPGKKGGVPQAMWFTVPVNFVLE